MSEQTESKVRAEEAAEAARVMRDEEMRRLKSYVADVEAAEAAAHKRSLAMEARVASVTSTCLAAINSLAQDTDPDDTGDIDEMRDRVLRALRAIYFPKPESPLTVVLEQVLSQIKPLLESHLQSLGQQVPGQVVGCCAPPDYIQRPGSAPSPDFQEAFVEALRAQRPGTFTAASNGTVTPEPETPSRVKQYWSSIAPGLTDDELLELQEAAAAECAGRGIDYEEDEVESMMDQFEDRPPPQRRSAKKRR